jgi:hypothetical protein
LGFSSLLAVLVLLIGHAATFHFYHKALKLLAVVQTIEAGKTSAEEVKEIAARFDGQQYDAHSYSSYGDSDKKYAQPDSCLDDSPSYSVAVSPPLPLFKAIQEFPTLQFLGLHPWFVSVGIQIKGEKVSCYSQLVWFIRRDGQQVGASADLEQRNPDSLFEKRPYQADSFVSRSFYHKTRASVLTGASAQEKKRAFQMDISCIVSFRGCYFPCQIMPVAWMDSVRERQSYGGSLPEGANDPRCPTIASPQGQ